MDLYIIRHADALPIGEQGVANDYDRPLSNTGHQQTRALAATLTKKGVRLDKMVTSPLVRARQTAEGMVKAWPVPTPEIVLCDDLAPGGKRRPLARFLEGLGGDSLGLVGHLPDLNDLVAWLIGSRKARIEMAKAGAAYVACDDGPKKGGGSLIWLTTPDWHI